jgi:hypothetical protein
VDFSYKRRDLSLILSLLAVEKGSLMTAPSGIFYFLPPQIIELEVSGVLSRTVEQAADQLCPLWDRQLNSRRGISKS